MSRGPDTAGPPQRLRVLAIASACHPEDNAESRVGWQRVLMASQQHDVTVLCNATAPVGELQELAAMHAPGGRLRFVHVGCEPLDAYCFRHDLLHLVGYRRWHRKVYRVARSLHDRAPFDLVHQVNFCGFREPGYSWRLDAPFVLGPIGGTQSFPLRYLGVTNMYNGGRELVRNVLNGLQLRYCQRLRRVVRRGGTVLAATHLAKRDLNRFLGISPEVELEAGLSYPPLPPRDQSRHDGPLRLLWTGRLRPWKGLPLLLHALAQLPQDVPCELRVLGEGADEAKLRRLAERLGVGHRIAWVGWGPYSQTLPHYRWADLFMFTSLRDTSGAGLLEALAAGTPIVGINHQGAADIMTEQCAVAINPSNPRRTAQDFAAAIEALYRDPARRLALSHGATARAASYVWRERVELQNQVYRDAVAGHARPRVKPTVGATLRAPNPAVSQTPGVLEHAS